MSVTLSNFHTHCVLDDGLSTVAEMCAAARLGGFQSLGFSAHAPLPVPSDWTLSEQNIGFFAKMVEREKAKRNRNPQNGRKRAGQESGQRQEPEILLGFEVDYLGERFGPHTFRAQYPEVSPDFLIGSIHCFETEDRFGRDYLAIDGPKSHAERLVARFGSVKEYCTAYYRTIAEMVERGGFDILGHLDKIKKNMEDPALFGGGEKWYRVLVEETVERISACRDKIVVEINTGMIIRYNDPGGLSPAPWILPLLKRYGLEVVVSSDAHHISHLGYYHREAGELLKEAGYKEISCLACGGGRVRRKI